MELADIQKAHWEKSYNKQENWILSPKEEIVKFLSRFIRRRTGMHSFQDKIDMSDNPKALDLGCGIGRQTILLREFGLNAYGIDLSSKAIETAKILCKEFRFSDIENNFSVATEDTTLAFDDNFFRVSISDCVLDSMHFSLAREYIKELDRVTDGYFYCSLISGGRHQEGGFDGETIVDGEFENGTIQSYFNEDKIQKLFSDTGFKIVWSALIREDFLKSNSINDRFYIVASNRDL